MNNCQRDFGIFYNKTNHISAVRQCQNIVLTMSWPSRSGLRGRRRTYLTILELAHHALIIQSKRTSRSRTMSKHRPDTCH
jgi:hypothetical protein